MQTACPTQTHRSARHGDRSVPDPRLDRRSASPQAAPAMTAITAADVAALAGVEPRSVEDLVERGILAPDGGAFVASDARRVGVVRALERAGLSLDSVGQA